MAVKTVQGVAEASVKTVLGVANASVKTIMGVSMSGGGSTLVKYEDFQAAAAGANNLTALTGWTAMEGGIGTSDFIAAKYAYPNTATDYGSYYWNTGASSLNQRAECLVLATDAAYYFGPAARMQTGAVSFYGVYINSTAISLQKRIAGSSTQLASDSTVLGAGDLVAIEVTGSGASTRISVQIDTGGGWSTIMSNVDPGDYLGSGKGGIVAYGQSQTVGLDEWYWYDL